jgi:hypothetical protein
MNTPWSNKCMKHRNVYYSTDRCPLCHALESAKPSSRATGVAQGGGVAYRGMILPLAEWARRLGIARRTLQERLKAGWTVRQAFETPVNRSMSPVRT